MLPKNQVLEIQIELIFSHLLGAESEYTKIKKEPSEITGVPSEVTERPRKRRFRATRSNLDLAVDTIKGFLVGFFR